MIPRPVLFYALVVLGVLLVAKTVVNSVTHHELRLGSLVMAALALGVALRTRRSRT